METADATQIFKEPYGIVEVDKIPTKESIVAVPIDNTMQVYKICIALKELCEKESGIGISAVQVGIPWKLFLVKGDGTCPLIPKGEFGYFINCEYDKTTDTKQVVSLEGCLSLRSPDGRLRSFQVERQYKIRLYGLQLMVEDSIYFKNIDVEVDVMQEGIVFQHEVDHHRGILVSDIGKEVFVW